MGYQRAALTFETVRLWCRKFGQAYANQLRQQHARPGDKWHLDEVFLTIRGQRHYLWRAVDQHGNVLALWFKADAIRWQPSGSSVSSSKDGRYSLESS